MAEFTTYGLAGARMDRIAARAAVNKAMIYYYFSSKAELHRQIITETFEPILARLRTAFEDEADVSAVLARFSDVYFEHLYRQPELRPLLLRELAEPDSRVVGMVAEAIVESGVLRRAVGMFQRKIDEGFFRSVDVPQALISFMLMNVGYVLLAPLIEKVWATIDRDELLVRRKQSLLDLFLYGVMKR